MRNKSTFANIFSLAFALVAALGSVYISYTKLKEPQILLDWLALIFSGLTVGVIAFFLCWGHFQEDPAPTRPESQQ